MHSPEVITWVPRHWFHHHPPFIYTAGSQPHERYWISKVGHIAAANGTTIWTLFKSPCNHPILKSMQIHNKSQKAPSVPLTRSMTISPLGNPMLGDCEAVKELPQGCWGILVHTQLPQWPGLRKEVVLIRKCCLSEVVLALMRRGQKLIFNGFNISLEHKRFL